GLSKIDFFYRLVSRRINMQPYRIILISLILSTASSFTMASDEMKGPDAITKITGTQRRAVAVDVDYKEKCPLISKKSGALDFIRDGFCFYKDVVIDTRTNLMWTRNANIAEKRMTWDDAIKWVEGTFFSRRLGYASYRNWRLPTVEELYFFANVAEGKNVAAYFNALGFNIVDQPMMFWTSTTAGAELHWGPIPINKCDWYVSMFDGHADIAIGNSEYYVWPVRLNK
ncbi:MAG TPA: DUF1566 domain-containing protein, partial [Nitrospirota bacterium]|nr:DUF1566 domain-containing protein [Nitrospirota bacterium]